MDKARKKIAVFRVVQTEGVFADVTILNSLKMVQRSLKRQNPKNPLVFTSTKWARTSDLSDMVVQQDK